MLGPVVPFEPFDQPSDVRPASYPNICQVVRETPHVWINETRVVVVWDSPMEGVGRPWFECPACHQRSRYLRGIIACRQCCRLDYVSRSAGDKAA